MNAFDIIVHAELRDAEASWLFLQSEGPSHVFQTFAWCAVWQQTLGNALGVRPCPVEVRDARGPAMLLPLCVEPSGGRGRLVFMDAGVADYNAPLVRRDALSALTPGAVRKLWKSLKRLLPPHDSAILRKMPDRLADGSPNPLLALSVAPHAEGSYQAFLDGDWTAFLDARSSAKTRANLRRKRRRLEDMGGFEIAMPTDAAEAEAIAGAVLDLKGAWLEANRLPNPLADPGRREFYLRITRDLAPSGAVHVSALRAGGSMLAGHWGAIHGGRFYYLLPAYAQGPWVRHSPGGLLLEALVHWSLERGLAVFDLTLGDEAYKMEWADGETRLFRLAGLRSVAGLADWSSEYLRGALAARPSLERLARRVLGRGR